MRAPRAMLEQAVTSNLAPITGKLGKMIRMLGSDCDGDVIAAARAIKRSLRSEGLDIHELAKAIEEPNGGARSNDPSTWGSYADAVAAVAAGNADGIGYMLKDSNIGAIDLDHCVDQESTKLEPWA